MNLAYIRFNKEENRYELHIDGTLKGYTQGDHEKGKDRLQFLAEEKGYKVIENE